MLGVDFSFSDRLRAHGGSVLVDCHWGWFGVMGWAGTLPGLSFDPMLQDGQNSKCPKIQLVHIMCLSTDGWEPVKIIKAGKTKIAS